MAETIGAEIAAPADASASRRGLQAAAAALSAARSAIVCGHFDPDGDAVGSSLALTAGLRQLGIDAVASWGSRGPSAPAARIPTSWIPLLPATDRIRTPRALPAHADVLVVCDCGAPSRLGTLEPLLSRAETVVVIDHHAVGAHFGDVRAVDPNASSTGILALELLDLLDVALSRRVANALYLAIMTDTGRFAFSSTSPADHRAAARLLEAGADHAAVSRAVYERASPGYLELVSRVTGRSEADGQLLLGWVSQDDLLATGATAEDAEGLLALLRTIDGVDVTCLLRELPDGRWRTSLRSRGATDVAVIAADFGGGGHRMAAGCTVAGELAGVRDALSAAVRAAHNSSAALAREGAS